MKEHDTVFVNSDKCENSLVTHDFTGTIVHIYKNETQVEVEDQDGFVYTVNKSALEEE